MSLQSHFKVLQGLSGLLRPCERHTVTQVQPMRPWEHGRQCSSGAMYLSFVCLKIQSRGQSNLRTLITIYGCLV